MHQSIFIEKEEKNMLQVREKENENIKWKKEMGVGESMKGLITRRKNEKEKKDKEMENAYFNSLFLIKNVRFQKYNLPHFILIYFLVLTH